MDPDWEEIERALMPCSLPQDLDQDLLGFLRDIPDYPLPESHGDMTPQTGSWEPNAAALALPVS